MMAAGVEAEVMVGECPEMVEVATGTTDVILLRLNIQQAHISTLTFAPMVHRKETRINAIVGTWNQVHMDRSVSVMEMIAHRQALGEATTLHQQVLDRTL